MSISTLYDSYCREEKEWEESATKLIGGELVLLDVSTDILDSRIYQSKNRVIKIRRIQNHSDFETRLHKEYEIELYLDKAFNNCNFEPHYEKKNGFEFLSTNYKGGTLVERLLEKKEMSIGDLLSIFIAVLRINMKGVCHRDLKSNNIKIDQSGRISLIDFDQAIKATPIRAIINDVVGVGIGIPDAIHPFRRLVQRAVSYKVPRLGNLLHKRNKVGQSNTTNTVLPLSEKAPMTSDLSKLKEAWEVAAQSSASSPGMQRAYYGLCLDGYGFLGERSWESRWDAVKNVVKFQDKTVLELGCNMGLFSTFMRLNGAIKGVGLDIDKDIINAAKMIAEAFGVDNQYKVQDFDNHHRWEEEYGGFDLVLALSIVNWVKDKRRLFAFLAKHEEVLYEGHDAFEIEYDRLSSCGFKNIQIVSVSERGRVVFYGRK